MGVAAIGRLFLRRGSGCWERDAVGEGAPTQSERIRPLVQSGTTQSNVTATSTGSIRTVIVGTTMRTRAPTSTAMVTAASGAAWLEAAGSRHARSQGCDPPPQ